MVKILICGFGDHGKDEVALRLKNLLGCRATSSSLFIGEKVVYPALKEKCGYNTFDECYGDRRNHRDFWFNCISDYNKPDPTRLTREILEEYDIYVGMRNPEEFEASKHLFDLRVWVDASERKPNEPKSSNGLEKEWFEYHLNNNGTLEDLDNEIQTLFNVVKTLEINLSNETTQLRCKTVDCTYVSHAFPTEHLSTIGSAKCPLCGTELIGEEELEKGLSKLNERIGSFMSTVGDMDFESLNGLPGINNVI